MFYKQLYFIFCFVLLKKFVYIVYFAHVCFLKFIMLVLCENFRVSMYSLHLQEIVYASNLAVTCVENEFYAPGIKFWSI